MFNHICNAPADAKGSSELIKEWIDKRYAIITLRGRNLSQPGPQLGHHQTADQTVRPPVVLHAAPFSVASPAASFGLYGRPRFLFALTCALSAVFVFFAVFPEADLAVSRLFFESADCAGGAVCGRFLFAVNTDFVWWRGVFYALPFAVLISILVINSIVFIRLNIPFWRDAKVVGALIGALVIGPGIFVNGVLKQYVLRSRPRDTVPFGGDLPFVPVGEWHGACAGNCSFVSGEAALAPIMLLSVLLFPKSWQRPAIIVLWPCSVAMALLRVMVGAHYISDVVLGYGLTVLIFCVLAQCIMFFSKRPIHPSPV